MNVFHAPESKIIPVQILGIVPHGFIFIYKDKIQYVFHGTEGIGLDSVGKVANVKSYLDDVGDRMRFPVCIGLT